MLILFVWDDDEFTPIYERELGTYPVLPRVGDLVIIPELQIKSEVTCVMHNVQDSEIKIVLKRNEEDKNGKREEEKEA